MHVWIEEVHMSHTPPMYRKRNIFLRHSIQETFSVSSHIEVMFLCVFG